MKVKRNGPKWNLLIAATLWHRIEGGLISRGVSIFAKMYNLGGFYLWGGESTFN